MRNKYGKITVKLLKTTLMDFYSAEPLAEGELRLLFDTNDLSLLQKPPHIPQMRSGDGG